MLSITLAGGELVEGEAHVLGPQAQLGVQRAEAVLVGDVDRVDQLAVEIVVGEVRLRDQGRGLRPHQVDVVGIVVVALQLVAAVQRPAPELLGIGRRHLLMVVAEVGALELERDRRRRHDGGVFIELVIAPQAVVVGAAHRQLVALAEGVLPAGRDAVVGLQVAPLAQAVEDADRRPVGAVGLQPVERVTLDQDGVVGEAAGQLVSVPRRVGRRKPRRRPAHQIAPDAIVVALQQQTAGRIDPGARIVDGELVVLIVLGDRTGHRELGRVVAEVRARPLQPGAGGRGVDRAGDAAPSALFGDQVDHPAGALRIERRGRVGDHLHPLDLVGGQLLQGVGAAGAFEHRRGLAVHQDGDVGIAPQRQRPLGVHLDGRQVAQRVADRAGGGRQVLAERVALAVDRVLHLRRGAGHRDRFDRPVGRLGLGSLGRLGRRRSRLGVSRLRRVRRGRGLRLGLGLRDQGRTHDGQTCQPTQRPRHSTPLPDAAMLSGRAWPNEGRCRLRMYFPMTGSVNRTCAGRHQPGPPPFSYSKLGSLAFEPAPPKR